MNVMAREFTTPLAVLTRRQWILPVLLFTILMLYLSILQSPPTMLDPDGFYHARMARMTWEHGYVSSFPWLPKTTLATYWTDQHFFYHLVVSPLTVIMDPLWGVKAGTVILGALFGIAFYFILSYGIQNRHLAFWWTILLFTSATFMFRLTLVKAQPLALILFFLLLYTFFHHRPLLFSAVLFLYVHTHGSFLLFPALLTTALPLLFFSRVRKEVSAGTVFKFLFFSVFVMLFGLITQPTFPDNLIFYWNQAVRIALFKVPEIEITGLEWKSLGPISWITALGTILLPTLAVFGITFFKKPRIRVQTLFLLWFLFPLAILSTRSIRHLEFFIPLLVFALACITHDIVTTAPLHLSPGFRKIVFEKFYTLGFILILLFTLFLYPIITVFGFQEQALSLMYLQHASSFLKGNSKDTVVANTRWDSFPMLFYHNPRGRYLTGLDSAFLHFRDPELERALSSIRKGDVSEETLRAIKASDAQYLFYMNNDLKKETEKSLGNYGLHVVFKDNEATIFSL